MTALAYWAFMHEKSKTNASDMPAALVAGRINRLTLKGKAPARMTRLTTGLRSRAIANARRID